MEDDETQVIFQDSNEDLRNVQTTKFRWVILAIYSLTAFANTLVWLSLFTVTDVTCAFFRIHEDVFLWSSNIFTLIQVLLAVPCSFLPSRLGLRVTMVIAASVNAVGACLMIASTNRDGFPFFIAGQTTIAIAACLLPQLAPEISSVWFAEKEQAISTSIGVILGNAGAAVGFLQPALLLKNVDPINNMPLIESKLKQLIYSQAALCVILLILTLAFFKSKPKLPPSISELKRKPHDHLSFVAFRSQFKKLLRDRNYHLCGNAFALNSVLVILVPVFLNEIVSWKFPGMHVTVGWMGFSGVLVGIVGSVVFSMLLDKMQAYKPLVLFIATATLLIWVGFTEALTRSASMPLTVTLFIAVSFVFISFGPIMVAVIAEMTYPISESSSYVLPITLGRFYSIPVVFLFGYLVQIRKFYLVCYSIAAILGLCVVLIVTARVTLKRKSVESGDVEE